MINYQFETTKKFDNEFFKLIKKCPSLENDFERLKNVIVADLSFNENKFPKSKYKRLSGLGDKVTLPVFKIKKFRCSKIKKGNRSGFRIIFIFNPKMNII
ncbi:MAG: hypothetical protein LBM96_12575 [Methanobrevibacter sp.]|jgi:hypothetical protein|nr:hypothetical protein [Candidatus Methanoflexus mossambicus]